MGSVEPVILTSSFSGCLLFWSAGLSRSPFVCWRSTSPEAGQEPDGRVICRLPRRSLPEASMVVVILLLALLGAAAHISGSVEGAGFGL